MAGLATRGIGGDRRRNPAMSSIVFLGALAFQAGIVGLLVVGLRRNDAAAATNAAVALLASLSPALLGFFLESTGRSGLYFEPALALWLAVAGFLHAVGMLGPYDTVWWWDHVTHAVSAALVAAIVYAALFVWAAVPGSILAAATIGVTLALGVIWELIELVARDVGERYGVEPVLVHYGWRDTALDLVFDVVGALVVVLFDLRVFVSVVEQVAAAGF